MHEEDWENLKPLGRLCLIVVVWLMHNKLGLTIQKSILTFTTKMYSPDDRSIVFEVPCKGHVQYSGPRP